MAPKNKDEKIIDPYTLISKKYFSIISRKNHNTDLFHDKANLFPEFSAFEKPCCSVNHKQHHHQDLSFPNTTVIKEIAKKYLPSVGSKTTSSMGTRSQSLAPTSSGVTLLEREKREAAAAAAARKAKTKTRPPQNTGANTPINELKGSRRASVEQIERKASVVLKRPYKSIVEGGQIMLERSKQLIEEIATPGELIERIRSQKRAESTQLQTDKDKIQRLAKRLDLSMKAHDTDETQKVFRFLSQVPMDYYRKLRNLKMNKGPKKVLQLNKTQEEISLQPEGGNRGRRVRRRTAVSRESTPMKQQQPEQHKSGATLSPIHVEEETSKQIATEMSPLRIPYNERSFESAMNKDEKITGTGIYKREKSLFLTGLSGMTNYLKNGGMYEEEKLSSLFALKGALKRSKTRGSDILSLHMEGQEQESQVNMTMMAMTMSSPLKRAAESKDEREAWMERVKEIRQGVTDYLGQDKSFLDVYQDEVNLRAKDFDLEEMEKNDEKDSICEDFEGDYERDDQDKIIDEVKNRDPEVYAILKQTLKGKGGSSAKNEANRETMNFYKKIVMKEKRKADGMMAAPKAEKSKHTSTKPGGRDIFNGPAN